MEILENTYSERKKREGNRETLREFDRDSEKCEISEKPNHQMCSVVMCTTSVGTGTVTGTGTDTGYTGEAGGSVGVGVWCQCTNSFSFFC